jgi:hypothetical protein
VNVKDADASDSSDDGVAPPVVPASALLRLLMALGGLFTLGRVIRNHDKRASRIHEDLTDWARDEARKEPKALKALLEELNKDNLFYSGHRDEKEKELLDGYAERWRNRKREAERKLEDLKDSENILHQALRKLRDKPWPKNPDEAELARVTKHWESRLG